MARKYPRMRLLYVLLLISAGLIQLGVVSNIGFWLSLPLTALLGAGIIWYLKPVLQTGAWRLLATLVIANFVMLALYAWSASDRTHITIHIDSTSSNISAVTNEDFRQPRPVYLQTAIQSEPVPAQGGIGLYMEDRRSDGTYFSYPDNTLGSLAAAIDASDLPAAWDNVVVRDNATGKILWQSNFDDGRADGWNEAPGIWFVNDRGEYQARSNGWTFAGNASWSNYTVEADLLRASTTSGIWILDQSGNPTGGLFLIIRPHNESMEWGTWGQNGFQPGKDAWGWFRKPLVAQAQEVLRLYLKTWQFTVLIAVLLAIAVLLLQLLVALPRYVLRPAVMGIVAVPPARLEPESGASAPDDTGDAASTSTRRRLLVLPDFDFPGFQAAVWLVVISALFATSAICLAQLEAIPHVQDSVAYYFQAKIFALGRLYVPQPPFPDAFQHEFVLYNDGKWFGKYPPGYPLLLAIGMLAHLPWLVNPLLGAGALALIALSGAQIYSRRTGLIAALLGLFSPFFLLLSASFMSHASGLFFTALFLYTFMRIEQEPAEGGAARWLVPLLAGIAAGWLFITRPYTAVLVLLPYLVYLAVRIWKQPLWWRWLIALPGALPLVGFMLLFNAVNAGNPFANTWEVGAPYDRLGFALQGIGMRNGHTLSDGLYVVMRNSAELLRDLYGWPFFVTLALALLPFALGAVRRWDWLLLASAGLLILGYSAYWADGIMYGPRYYFEGLASYLLLTARGVDVVAVRAEQVAGFVLKRRNLAPSGLLLAGVLVFGLMAINVMGYLPQQITQAKGYNYTNANRIHLVEQAGIHHALIFVQTSAWYAWWDYGSVFSQNDPLLQGDVIYARDLGDDRNRQVAAAYPGRVYYRITTDLRLVRLYY